MTTIPVGLWIDDPVSLVLTPEYWDRLARHHIRTAALMLEGPAGEFNPKYTLDDLVRIRGLANSRDIEVVITTWPEPTTSYLDDYEAHIGDYLRASGAAALEGDMESNWIPNKVRGFKNLDLAGDRLVVIFDKMRREHEVRTEGTTFTMHSENSKCADVLSHVDRTVSQGYSVRHRTNEKGEDVEIEWGSQFSPGPMQILTFDRALLVPGAPTRPKLSCGLAAYDQSWPGQKLEEAMRVAYETAVGYQPQEIRYWSSRHVLGTKANGYASRFLLSLTK